MYILEIISNFISKDGDKLPAKLLYHGTTLKQAEQILKTGLDPKFSQNRGEHTLGFVFLSHNINGARAFAPGGEYSNSKEPGAIIEITNTIELSNKIRTRLGEFIRCPASIPPNLLKIVEYTNQ